MTCEHEDYKVIDNFPEDIMREITNKIKCVKCGKIGRGYYHFVERTWDSI